MCILIESAEELAYVASPGHWTKKPGKGSCFASTRAAFAPAKMEPIGEFNIVRFFALNGQFINLEHGSGKRKGSRPVQPASHGQASPTEMAGPAPGPANTSQLNAPYP